MASTTIIGDVVKQVGGNLIDLMVLLPPDSDPHSFSPAPKDVALVETAQLVFLNGFDLEEGLADLIVANASGKIVTLSGGIEPILLESDIHKGEEPEESGDSHGTADPHVWMDPSNVMVWVERIARELSALDPEHAPDYRTNADRYLAELQTLDSWVRQQTSQIPPERRVLVTDHDTLGYFAAAYDFEIIGVVVMGGSTLSDPSAQQIAALEAAIVDYKTPAIFVGNTVNNQLSERIAQDTGITLVTLHTGSLSAPDGPVPDYIEMMRYNVNAIVEALK